ncbi:hypothetical protein ACFLTC_02845 [Chloroflexota bacterium]
MLPVKESRLRLLEALRGLFYDAEEMRWVVCDSFWTVNKGRDRIETRERCTTSDPEYLTYISTLADWRGSQSIATIEALRQSGEQTTTTRRYFMSNLETNAGIV